MPVNVEKFPNENIRILTMDGGGIYGYITALMLRRLCEEDESFLSPDQIWLFAGTSAGALNSLMLARAKNPREVVMTGSLERFWQKRGTFANELNPMASYLSWFGITGWLGAADFDRMLTDIYGDMTLGDLEHRILITAFNWSGVGQQQMNWRPKVFVNFPEDDADRSILIRHVAYGAAAPPGLRAVTHGIGDGGTVTPDPAMCALVETVKEFKRIKLQNADQKALEAILGDVFGGLISSLMGEEDTATSGDIQALAESQRTALLGSLTKIRLLSLGVCTKPGVYWLPNFDFGSTLFSQIPTNPSLGQWYPPQVQVGLDGPSEATTQHARVMLGKDRFHRLDPPLLGPPEEPPTLVATAYARFPAWQRHLLERQRTVMNSRIAAVAVKETLAFLEADWYDPPENPSPKAASASK